MRILVGPGGHAVSSLAMPPATLTFRGFAGRRRRRVTAVDGALVCSVGERYVEVRPPEAAWTSFWATADVLDVWRWAPEYGRMLHDGQPWWLSLHHADRRLDTSANGLEEHAPPGARLLLLALDDLLGARLLHPDDARHLRKRYLLRVLVTRESRPPISDHVLLSHSFKTLERALADRGINLSVHRYTHGTARDGAAFLLDAPPDRATLEHLRRHLADRDPTLSLVDFTTGAATDL